MIYSFAALGLVIYLVIVMALGSFLEFCWLRFACL
jgi:hypothetical protein